MSVYDDVRTARSPQEAMLALAEGLDAVLDALTDQANAEGQWGTWATPDEHVPQGVVAMAGQSLDNAKEIAAVEVAIAAATDPEDARALEARLRLLKDDGRALDINAPAGLMPTVEESADSATLVIPAPSKAKKDRRLALAHEWKLHEFLPLTDFEAADAYAKGGPQWLYGYDRDAVMQMPYAYRQAMVEDVLEDSPRAAHEMARDILKDTGTGNSAVAGTMLGVDIGGSE